jgi:hypothetical protein
LDLQTAKNKLKTKTLLGRPLVQGVVLHPMALLERHFPVGFWEISLQMLLDFHVFLSSSIKIMTENKNK